MKISKNEGLKKLEESNKLFIDLFTHGTLKLEAYKPEVVDLQQPHTQDEVYIVISGDGDFLLDDKRYSFEPGDFLFAPAGVAHRFENFSSDFATWVIFYGPNGGEQT